MDFPVEEIRKKAEKVLKAHKEVSAAYLYGSVARGQARKGSDIDIGLLLSRGYEPEPMYEAHLSLELEKALDADTEAKVLNGGGLIFLHQVLKHGMLLFSRDEKARIDFETDTYSRYLDRKYFYDQYNRIRAERLLA